MESQVAVIAPELHLRPSFDVATNWSAIARQKNQIKKTSTTTPTGLATNLYLDRIVSRPADSIQNFGVDISRATPRRQADAMTIVAAASEVTQGRDYQAALLLATNYQAQLELKKISNELRDNPNGKDGLEVDVQSAYRISNRLGQLIESNKIDRLLGMSVAQVAKMRKLDSATTLRLLRAVSTNQVDPADRQLVSEVHIIRDTSQSLRLGLPRVTRTEAITFSEITNISGTLLNSVHELRTSDGRKKQIKEIIEARVPEKISSLDQVVKIVESNPDIQAVSFDMYDTLVQWSARYTERTDTFAQRVHKALQVAGVNKSFQEVRDTVYRNIWFQRGGQYWARGEELPMEDMMRGLSRELSITGSREVDFQKLLQKEWYRVELDASSVMPGARETLDQLKKMGIKIALTSNASWTEQHIKRVLKRFGLLDYFDSISISSEIKKVKHHSRPDFFHHSWAKLGVSVDEVLHVGDNPRDDVEGARNAGGKATHYDNPRAFKRLDTQDPNSPFMDTTSEVYRHTAYDMERQSQDQDIESWIRIEMRRQGIPKIEQDRVERMAKEIYPRTRDTFAPVYIRLAEDLLNKLQTGEADQVLALARDGLAISAVAKLLRHFEYDRYDRVKANQIKYVHISRGLMERVLPTNIINSIRNLAGGAAAGFPPVSDRAYDPDIHRRYVQYLDGLGVTGRGKKTIFTDIAMGRGQTHMMLKSLLPDQNTRGLYLDTWKKGDPLFSDAQGFLQETLHTNEAFLRPGGAQGYIFFFESLLNGINRSATQFREIVKPNSRMALPSPERKQPTPDVLTKGLSPQSILFMNRAAMKGVMDAVRLRHREHVLGLPGDSTQQVLFRFIDYMRNAPIDEVRLNIPWEDGGQWLLPEQNQFDMKKN